MANDEWILVERITIAGAAATTQDFATALNGDVDLGYKVCAFIKSDAAGDAIFSLRVNGATIAANRRYIQAVSTTVSTAATASATGMLTTDVTSDEGAFEAYLSFARTGYERFWRFWTSKSSGSTDYQEEFFGTFRMTTPNTATNITSLGVVSDTASGIGIGSILELYKKGA